MFHDEDLPEGKVTKTQNKKECVLFKEKKVYLLFLSRSTQQPNMAYRTTVFLGHILAICQRVCPSSILSKYQRPLLILFLSKLPAVGFPHCYWGTSPGTHLTPKYGTQVGPGSRNLAC